MGAALRSRMRPKSAHAREPVGISLHPCILATLGYAVPHRLNSCAWEMREIARPVGMHMESCGDQAGSVRSPAGQNQPNYENHGSFFKPYCLGLLMRR